MKTKLFLLITGLCSACIYAQVEFQEHIISTNANGASIVYSADLNGDGDMDILSADIDKVAWYENFGRGNFGPQQIIVEGGFGRTLDPADVDLDGDIDVLVGTGNIYWVENIDGLGDFASQHYIGSGDRASFTDLDGDGDMDVLTTVRDSNTNWGYWLIWYPNVGGGNFPNYQNIAYFEQWGPYMYPTILPADIDGDGDIDLFFLGGWYENFGRENFGSWQDLEVPARYFEDLDGDGDIDLISWNNNNQNHEWYRNEGQGNFSYVSPIGNGSFAAIYVSDLDNDEDMDVISANSYEDKIAWYENSDGLGDFGSHQLITTNTMDANSVYAEDIDGDGDMDVLSASRGDDKIAWYENSLILAVNENASAEFTVYPIPTRSMLTIESKTSITEIEIYNQLGQIVMSTPVTIGINHPPAGRAGKTIDISSVSQGVYFVKIKDENGNIGTQKVVKN